MNKIKDQKRKVKGVVVYLRLEGRGEGETQLILSDRVKVLLPL